MQEEIIEHPFGTVSLSIRKVAPEYGFADAHVP
jgi:hypothetical protein